MIDVVELAAEEFMRNISALTEGQIRAASLLPGWSHCHVIAHVALNAEGFVAVAGAPDDRRPALMYPGGTAQRDQDIAMLAQSTTGELLKRSRESNDSFIQAWCPAPSIRECATAEGHPVFSSSAVLSRRLRELQVHLLDLNIEGVGTDLWLPNFVDADLELQWPTVAQRTSEPVAVVDELGTRWETEPAATERTRQVVQRRDLLAWVVDRGEIEGMPRLEPWSNRSKWEFLSSDL